MNKKEKRQLGLNWLMAVEASVIGLFLSISGNALYDILIQGWNLKMLLIGGFFGLLAMFLAGLLMFMFENIDMVREREMTSSKIILEYLKRVLVWIHCGDPS